MKRAMSRSSHIRGRLFFWRVPYGKLKKNKHMKTKTLIMGFLSVCMLFTSCENDELAINPSSNITTESFTASNITELDVESVFKVYITFSDTEESVTVEANENLHDIIDIVQDGSRLNIALERNSNIRGEVVLNVYIKTQYIDKISADGASSVAFENILAGNNLNLRISGASQFTGSLEVDELHANLYGASQINLTGSSNSFNIVASGASRMTGFGFETNTLTTDLEGASMVSITVNESMDITAREASMVNYKGDAEITKQQLTDASVIVNRN